jgi:hypothetical protein
MEEYKLVMYIQILGLLLLGLFMYSIADKVQGLVNESLLIEGLDAKKYGENNG